MATKKTGAQLDREIAESLAYWKEKGHSPVPPSFPKTIRHGGYTATFEGIAAPNTPQSTATWEIKRSSKSDGVSHLTIHNRKVNDADEAQPIGLAMTWAGNTVSWTVDDPMYEEFQTRRETHADRIAEVLSDHPLTAKEIAHLLGISEGTARETMRRDGERFRRLDTGNYALLGRTT